MIKITINIYVYVIECPYAQLLLEKNTYIIQSQNKTKFNQCTNATKKRDTTFILPCMLKYNDK